MEFTPEVEAAAAEAAAAVQALMSPHLPPGERQRTYELCERLKESPACIQYGLYLAEPSRPAVVRHLGLQILEHTVRFRWNDLAVQDKLQLKTACQELMVSVPPDAPAHMREALCRPLVEIVKREWPQQYPEFLSEMQQLSARGPAHTELVLRVFLRLAEDVATFQTLEAPARRRDIYQGLVSNMDTIFGLLVSTLSSCVSEGSGGGQEQLTRTCLSALVCYLEWAAVKHVLAGEAAVLALLLQLISRQDGLQPLAAECLAVLFGRHGKPEEREALLAVLQPSVMDAFVRSVEYTVAQPPSDTSLATLRFLTQTLTSIVGQLTYCWGRTERLGAGSEPAGLAPLLAVLLDLSCHPSALLLSLLLPAWTQLFRHKLARQSPALLSVLPAWYRRLAWPRARRQLYPPADPTARAIGQLEFDSQEEFHGRWGRLRQEMCEALRSATEVDPETLLGLVEETLTRVMNTPLPTDLPGAGELPRDSDQLLDWEALAFVTDHVTARVAATRQDLSDRAASLLEVSLARQTADPSVLNLLLSVLSSLANFLPSRPRLTAPLLTRLFDAAAFGGAVTRHTPRSVKELRRHACNALITLSVRQPAALSAEFPAILARVQTLLPPAGPLGLMEAAALTELLISVHGHAADFQQRSELIGRLLAPHLPVWQRLGDVIRSPAAFLSAVGLTSPPPPAPSSGLEESAADVERQATRTQLTLFVNLLNGVLQRCRVPLGDTERLQRGGYLHPTDGHVLNPCTEHVLPHLTHVFHLLRTLSQLEAPGALALVHQQYRHVLDIPASKRAVLLYGAPAPNGGSSPAGTPADPERTPLERMQGFVGHVYETAHAVLSGACTAMGPEFFRLPRLTDYLAGSLLHGLEHLSDHRLHVQVRSVWRAFIWRCPAELHQSVLVPPLTALFSHLAERLDNRWQHLQTEPADSQDCEQEAEAVVAEQVLRQLTRDSLYLAQVALTTSGPGPGGATGDLTDAMEEDGDAGGGGGTETQTVGTVGQVALGSPQLAHPLLTLVFKCIGWGDSNAARKATDLTPLVVRALTEAQTVDDTAASQLFYWLLHGLEVHGHQDTNLTSLCAAATVFYLKLRPAHPVIDQVLVQIPEVTEAMVTRLHEAIFNHPRISHSDKLRKEEIKKILKPLVSQSMSQLFQKKASIRDLLPMVRERMTAKNGDVELVSLDDLFGDS